MYSVEETLSMLSDIYDFELAAGPIYEGLIVSEHYYCLTGDQTIATEGFSDFIDSIGATFKNLIEKIKEFFKTIIRAIASHGMDLKQFCNTYKKEIDELDNVDFKINGYKFAVLDSKKPDMSEFQEIVASYNNSLTSIDKVTKEILSEKRLNWFSTSNLDKIRAEVLGVSTSIPEDKYTETVKKHYRGSVEPEEISIDTSYIREIQNHVQRLYDSKRAAAEDRDRILRLLSQAEMFFERKVDTVYRGNAKIINASSISADEDDGKLTTVSTVELSSNKLKTIQDIVSLKYDQTRKISSIISTAITERAKAFNDQAKQERAIVGKALTKRTGDTTTSTTEESLDIFEKPALDYDQIAYETKEIFTQYHKEHIAELCEQSKLVLESLESGSMQIPVTEGALKNLTDKIRKFLNDILNKFKDKMNLRDEQYGPWIRDKDVEDSINDVISKFDTTLEMLPMWKGRVQSDFQGVSTMLGAMERGLKDESKKINWFEQIKTFTNAKSVEELKDRAYVEELKNYFRAGDKTGKKLETESLNSGNANTIIPQMIKYCQNFNSMTDKIAGLRRRVDAIKVTESIDPWLYIEGCPVSESSLIVLEAEGDTAAKAAEIKPESSPTTIKEPAKDEETKAGRKDANDAKESITDKTNSSTDDMNFALKYTQTVVTEFCRVCEERYTLYIKTLLKICPMEVYPQFKDGKYVGTKKGTQVSEKKATKESVDYTALQTKSTKGINMFK